MSTSPSTSRAELLLREAAGRGVSDVHLKTTGEGATISMRVDGQFQKELERFVPDVKGLVGEFKDLCTHKHFEDEYEWFGHILRSIEERDVWFELNWFRDKGADSMLILVLNGWLSFSSLGLNDQDAAALDELISLPRGVIVGCGSGGSGHATTLNALIERLAQNGKRVAALDDWSDPRVKGVTQLEINAENPGEQVAFLADNFDVFAFWNFRNQKIARVAFDLAASGHLVLGLIYSLPVETALARFLDQGISPDELKAYFLGGWSQTLVRRAGGKGRIGVFDCMSREEAQQQTFEHEWLNRQINEDESKRVWWRDIKDKIVRGEVRREDVPSWLNP